MGRNFEPIIEMIVMNKTRKLQKISLGFAFLFYFGALICLAALIYFYSLHGIHHPSVAAFSAAIVFFIGAGIVLHVMGKADIPNFRL